MVSDPYNPTPMKPIKSNEIIDQLDTIIPNVVIEAVNNLLKEKFRGISATILQKDIVAEIIRLDSKITSKQIFDKKWMDFEEIYKKNGWLVTYDGPAYNESYEPSFNFKVKKK